MLYWFIFGSKQFDEPYDGIMYAVAVSLGFAALENFGFALSLGVEAAIARMFTAIPVHTLCGVVMGFFVGLAKFSTRAQKPYLLMGLVGAVLVHGTYDYLLFLQIPSLLPVVAIFLLIQISLAGRAIKQLREYPPVDEQRVCRFFAPGADAFFELSIFWSTIPLLLIAVSLFVLAVTLESGDLWQFNLPYLSDLPDESLASALLLCGLALIAIGAALRMRKRWALPAAFAAFVVVLPTPLFVFGVAGMYGLFASRAE